MGRNVLIVGVAIDNPGKLKIFRDENQFEMEIIPDPKGTLAKQYNAYSTGSAKDNLHLKFKLAVPSTYLINQQGKITWRYVGTREDRPSIELLFQAIEENIPEYKE